MLWSTWVFHPLVVKENLDIELCDWPILQVTTFFKVPFNSISPSFGTKHRHEFRVLLHSTAGKCNEWGLAVVQVVASLPHAMYDSKYLCLSLSHGHFLITLHSCSQIGSFA